MTTSSTEICNKLYHHNIKEKNTSHTNGLRDFFDEKNKKVYRARATSQYLLCMEQYAFS